jgi:hypothetical protein
LGDDFVEDFEDFGGLGLLGVLCLTDFDLRFIRDALAAGIAGVLGVGVESDVVSDLFIDILRGKGESRLDSVTSLATVSKTEGSSSTTGEMVDFSVLFLVNIPRSPPLDSFR